MNTRHELHIIVYGWIKSQEHSISNLFPEKQEKFQRRLDQSVIIDPKNLTNLSDIDLKSGHIVLYKDEILISLKKLGIPVSGIKKLRTFSSTIVSSSVFEDIVNDWHAFYPSTIPSRYVRNISCGESMVVFSDNQDCLWKYDMLSMSTTSRLKLLERDFYCERLDCGLDHCLVIGKKKSDSIVAENSLYSFGCGNDGQLGLGYTINSSDDLNRISFNSSEYPIQVAAGYRYSMVITAPYGFLYTFGIDLQAQFLPDRSGLTDRLSPKLESTLTGVGQLLLDGTTSGLKICRCGPWHAIAVSEGSNDIYCWGWNNFCQLGVETKEVFISTPTRISDLNNISLLTDSESILDVTCGSRHTALLTSSNKVIVMGMLGIDDSTQLFTSSFKDNIDQLSQLKPRILSSGEEQVLEIHSFEWGLGMLVQL